MNQLKPINDNENTDIIEIEKQFNESPRFTRWRELYFDKDNLFKLNTFKNRTLSAIHAYELDPNDPKQKKYAYKLGSKNARKCKNWAQEYLSELGVTPEKILEVIAAKALNTDNPRYMQLLAEITGVYNPKAQVVINNNNQNNTQINISEAEKENFDEQFRKLVESR